MRTFGTEIKAEEDYATRSAVKSAIRESLRVDLVKPSPGVDTVPVMNGNMDNERGV